MSQPDGEVWRWDQPMVGAAGVACVTHDGGHAWVLLMAYGEPAVMFSKGKATMYNDATDSEELPRCHLRKIVCMRTGVHALQGHR